MGAATNHDQISMDLADDVISIDHYRVREAGRYLTVSEIDPHCDALNDSEVARYATPDEAEAARDQFALVNEKIGLPTDAVVVGLNSAGVVLAIDGQPVPLPNEDGSDIPF